MRFADENDLARGIEFAGRVAEEFKLSSGTWVHTGALRVKAIAAMAPAVQDLVLTGHDAADVGFLIFPNVAACRQLATGLAVDASPAQVLAHADVRAAIAHGMPPSEREEVAVPRLRRARCCSWNRRISMRGKLPTRDTLTSVPYWFAGRRWYRHCMPTRRRRT